MAEYRVSIDDRELVLELGTNGQVSIDGNPCSMEIVPLGDFEFLVRNGQRQHRIAVVRQQGGYLVIAEGVSTTVVVETPRDRLIREHAREGGIEHTRAEVHAPMPAMVVRIQVSEGESVTAGQGLVVLEAMKMENELRAPRDGTVRAIQARAGVAVEKGALLMILE